MEIIDNEEFQLELRRERPHVMIDDGNGDAPWRDSDHDLMKILSDSNTVVEKLDLMDDPERYTYGMDLYKVESVYTVEPIYVKVFV